MIRTGVTTTILDADGRGTVSNVIASAGPDLAQPVVPVSPGYVTWSSTNGRGSFYRTRASSRGLEWEAVGGTTRANVMVGVQRSGVFAARAVTATREKLKSRHGS